MPLSANPITVLLETIFAMINIALSIVFSYVGTLATFAIAALVLAGVLFGVISLLRGLGRR